jgi:radial spoke head protein 4A
METETLYQDLISQLEEIKSQTSKETILSLLTKMFEFKQETNDNDFYMDRFEDIALKIKKNGEYFNDKEKRECLEKYLSSFTENIKKKKSLLEPLMQKPEDPEGEATPITAVNFIEDYHNLFQKLSYCGISLGEEESFLLTNSLRNLSGTLQTGQISFFGKIYGSEKDYYIAQVADMDPPADFNYDPDMEQRKNDGVNRDVYFVTNDLSDNWVELPDVKPEQVRQSRLIRYIFTGNLKKPIYSNPHFNGLEEHYLRCQIARIYHGTKLVPNINHWNLAEPDNPDNQFMMLVPNEKPLPFKHNDLLNMKNWIHFLPSILKQGRVSHFIEVPEDAPDPEEYQKKERSKDPFDERMKSITKDNFLLSGSLTNVKIPAWKLCQVYEDKVYINPYIKLLEETPDFDPADQKDNKADYGIICIKSLIWPGAYNFYFGKQCYFFYFGNGLKFIDTQKDGNFNYKAFPKLPIDLSDLNDEPEPNFPPKEPGEEGEDKGEEQGDEDKKDEDA